MSDDLAGLAFSIRTAYCLRNARIETVRDLASRSESELLAIPNFGRKSLNEVKYELSQLGLSLRGANPKEGAFTPKARRRSGISAVDMPSELLRAAVARLKQLAPDGSSFKLPADSFLEEAARDLLTLRERYYDERAAKMAEMRRQGMFFRQIGEHFGVSDGVVQQTLQKRGYSSEPEVKQKRVLNSTPTPEPEHE